MNEKTGNDLSQINPKVSYITIGIRHLRKIKMYPLSLKDEIEMFDLLKEFFEQMAEMGKASEQEGEDSVEMLDFLGFLIEFILSNIGEVMSKTVDENPDDLIADMDNDQAYEFAVKFLENNFGGLAKKVLSLLGLEDEGVNLSDLWRQFVQSSPNILNSLSNISSNTASKKEDLQEDN